ncbi:hypothetical protein EKB5_07090 [Helicobacter pylori]
MSKDRDYKPVFNPKSQEVLEKMNAEKRASLENESLTITEIENSNKKQEIKGNTKSDDEVKQHIEQVIEKEIGKGAEIISSKEVAITNNVDYYENEEELETTQSRAEDEKQPSKKSNKLFSFLNGIKWRDLRLIMRVIKLVKYLARFK